MKCNICQKEINDGAKFCKFCGSAVVSAASNAASKNTKRCPACSAEVAESAKFCKKCGYNLGDNEPKKPVAEGVEIQSNYITWRVLEGQLAVKIDEREIKSYKTIKGVYITPGTKALFFADGKHVVTLDSGRYPFQEINAQLSSNDKKDGRGFFKSIARWFKRNNVGYEFYTIVLVRSVDFPLMFDFTEVALKNVKCDVGIHLLCRISDINAFYQNHFLDNKSGMVTMKSLANSIQPIVKGAVYEALQNAAPENVNKDSALASTVLSAIGSRLKQSYSYIVLNEIIEFTTKNDAIEDIRGLQSDLYIAELELQELQERNNFLNRLQNVENSQELAMARTSVDFRALMDKIDEDGMLNDAKKNQFAHMLEAQLELANATTDSEKKVALDKLVKNELLSTEEIDALKREIEQRKNMDEVSNQHALALATIQNKIIQDKEALRWEIEIGNKALENDLTRARMTAAFEDERRSADLDFQKRRANDKLDLLRQAQEIREARENAQHMRDMESSKQRNEFELERQRINATMTFEQIMASNPDITPEAASALAKKFEAEASAAQNDRTVDIMRQHDEDLKAILAQQMALTKEIVSSQNRANADALSAKEREIERIHADSERNQDRNLENMKATIGAFSGAAAKPKENKPEENVYCETCGAVNSASSAQCSKCGGAL